MADLPSDIKNRTFLIVDDAPSMRSLLSAIIKSFGIKRVYEAADGNEALRVLEKRTIDIVFCDWEMPKMDGLQLYENLLKDEKYSAIPFVLVTSAAELDKVKTALAKGIQEYVVKPFKEDTILSKIVKLLEE